VAFRVPAMGSPSKVKEFFESLELGRPRTPAQLAALLNDVERGFGASEQLRKESGRKGRGRLQTKYFEEIYPLAVLARHLFSDRSDVLCEPNLDDTKSFDAVITIGSPTHCAASKLLVEFTYPKDGQDEERRMQVLSEQGHVSLTARLTVTGTRKTGRHIAVGEDIGERRDERLKKCLRLILNGLDRKASPKYGSVDMLVVVFDDFLGFRKPDELAHLRGSIESSPILSKLNFTNLILLGSSGKAFLEFGLPKS
jgi:hypothetical protein